MEQENTSVEFDINNLLEDVQATQQNPTYVNSKLMRTYFTNPIPVIGERGTSKVHVRLHGLAYIPPIGSLLTKQLAKSGKKVIIHYSDEKHSNKIGVDIDGTMETWTSVPGSLLVKSK